MNPVRAFALLAALGCAGGAAPVEVPAPASPRAAGSGVHASVSDKPDPTGDPMAGVVMHGTFGEPLDVELLPPPTPNEPLARNRRRVDIDQLDAIIRAATGGIGWEVAGKSQLTELSLTLGKPDYLDQTHEDLDPSALFEKFLGDAARAVCRDVRVKDVTLAAGERALMIDASPDDTYASAPGAIESNLRTLLLRFHGRQVPAAAPELEHWRWLYQTAELKLGKPALAWQAVCVGLMTHPDFYTY
jgi:hypothetical protein